MRALIVSHSAVVPLYREKFHILARLGWEVHLALPPGWPEGGRWIGAPQPGHEAGITIHVLGARFIGKVGGFYLRGLSRLIDRIQPDLVYAEEEPYGLTCWQVVAACRGRKIPAAFFTWENLLRRYKPPLSWIDRWVLARVRWAIAGNQEALQVLRQRGFAGEILVLPQYGIRPENFPPAPRRGGPDQVLVVGFMGRLLEEKGIHTLLQAAARLTIPWELRIIGNGPYEPELRRLAGALKVSDRVRFQAAVPNDRVADALAELDVLVLPSEPRAFWKEQFGRILAEAMACEIPVVGSDSGEIPNVIGEAGLVFPEGDPGRLADCLARLGQDRGLARQLGQAGRQRALALFTTESITARTDEFFKRMISKEE